MAWQWSMLTVSNTWAYIFTHLAAPLKAKAARSWGVVQQRHSQLQGVDTVNLMLSLLQSILVPAAVICGECTPRRVKQRQPELTCSLLVVHAWGEACP